MDGKTAQAQQLDHLRTMIERAKVAMLTTIDAEQQLRSRPLHTADMDGNGDLWFMVAAAAPKTGEMAAHDGKVCLSYANRADHEYVSISGSGRIVRDSRKKAELWSEINEVWFPNGLDDPDVALLKVTPEKGEFWEGPSNVVTQFYAFAKAVATGDRAAMGDSGKIRF